MKEVSCKALGIFFRELKKKKLPAALLANGTGYSLDHLQNKQERIDWSAYLAFIENAKRIWNDDDFFAMGAAVPRSPIVAPMSLVIRLLFTAKDAYRWMMSESGGGQLMFSCIQSSYKELQDGRVQLDMRMADNYPPSREFFILTKGSFAELPRLVGLGSATVDLAMHEHGATYTVAVPKGGGLLPRFRRFLLWPFTVRAAANELREANHLLQQRYMQIEASRQVIDAQARRLQIAHTISLELRRAHGLHATCDAAATLLVSVAGFPFASLAITKDEEGRAIDVVSNAGERRDSFTDEHSLISRGRTVGLLTVAIPNAKEGGEHAGLIDFLMPTIATAIDDALAVTSLTDYRVNLEHKVIERTEELKAARDELERNFVELRAAKLARDRIFANVNHELRTPLSLMLLAAEATRDRESASLQERSRVDLANVAAGGRRLLRLVDDLLALAAGQEGKLDLSIFRTDVASILRQVTTMWLPAAERFGVDLVYEGPESDFIEVDPQAFERMVTNLVSNAVKFTPNGGTITVGLAESGEVVRVSVRDTGIGLSEDFKKRVFGRFEQGREAVNPTSRGSGIGLSLVKTLAEAHHGAVGVESVEGAGTTFTITLPTKQDNTKLRAPTESAQLSLAPSDFGLRAHAAPDGPTILEAFGESKGTALVAEDDPELRSAIAEVLRADYRVLLASDGMAALALAHKHLPDVLVSDIGMPEMDGFELSRRFRELPGNRLAPVILLTAFRTLKDRLIGFEAGAVDYITKPFDPEELKARVRSQLAVRDLALRLHQAEKVATLSVLSTGLAHEFRNPANGIVNAIEPIKDILAGETLIERTAIDQLLRVVSEGAVQIRQLSKQLLGFGRQGELQLRKEAFPQIVRRALAMLSPPPGVTIEDKTEFEGDVFCAGPLLTQSLNNLLENAVQACGREGVVTLSARARGDYLDIEVTDTGPGIPADQRERIFDPFFTTKGPGGGTGLGLTTARQIAASHGGTLTVIDAPAGGAFLLRIPLSESARFEAAERMAGK